MSEPRELPLLRHEIIVLPQMRSALPLTAELESKPDRFLMAQPGSSRGTLVEVVERSTVIGKGPCATLRGVARAEIEPSKREGWARYELVVNEPAADSVPALADELRQRLGLLLGPQAMWRLRFPLMASLMPGSDATQLADCAATEYPETLRGVLDEPSLEGRLRLLLTALQPDEPSPSPLRRLERAPAAVQMRLDELLVWKHPLSDLQHATRPAIDVDGGAHPLVHGDLVIVSLMHPALVVAVNRCDGSERWSHLLPGFGGHAPRLSDPRLIVNSTTDVRALDVATGEQLWTFCPITDEGEWIYSAPAVDDQSVYFGDRTGLFYCLDVATGRPRWATRLADDHSVNANSLCWGELVLTGSNAGVAFGCALETGEITWRTDLGAPCRGSVLRAGKWAVFVTMNGLCWVCPRTGRVEQRYEADQGMLWSVCVCGETVLALEHRAQHAYHLQAFGPELLYQHQVPSFTQGYTWCSATGFAYESSHEGLVILDPATGARLVDVVGQPPGCTVHAEADFIYLIAGSPGQTPRLCALRHPAVPTTGPIAVDAIVPPPAAPLGCEEQVQGARGYRWDGKTVLALPHFDRSIELVEVPGTERWRLAPDDERLKGLVPLSDDENDRLRSGLAAGWKPHQLAGYVIQTLRFKQNRQFGVANSSWGPDWSDELLELALPDHIALLRELQPMQVPPPGLPAVAADLERRIRKLAQDPSGDMPLFCLLCYEAFGCEGTISAKTRDYKARDPYAPGSFHLLPDDTLVQFPLRGEGDEVREVCGERRWFLGSESGLTRTDLRPQTEEGLAKTLRALSFEEVESRTMLTVNRLLERLRSVEGVEKAHDLRQRAMEEVAEKSGARGVLAELSGPLTPDHPELTRIVVAVLMAAMAALPKEEVEAFSEVWRDYGLMRWARKGA